jgi:hypothetical protein
MLLVWRNADLRERKEGGTSSHSRFWSQIVSLHFERVHTDQEASEASPSTARYVSPFIPR